MTPKRSQLADLENLFAALSDGTRLRLLNLMRAEEVCVCYLADALGTDQPKVSRHLALLRRGGIVVARRDGKWMYYSINPNILAEHRALFRGVFARMDRDPQMRKDRALLRSSEC